MKIKSKVQGSKSWRLGSKVKRCVRVYLCTLCVCVCMLIAYLLLFHTNAEVRLIELVGDVPAQGPKLSSLLHEGVEEAQPKEKLAPGAGLVAALKEVEVRYRVGEVGSEEVGTETLGRLVGHLNTCVKWDEERRGKGAGRRGRARYTYVVVAAVNYSMQLV